MDRTKIVVVAIVGFIIVGTLAWAGAERFQSPDYNPEKAHEFLEHFYARCNAEFGEEVCGDVVGHHHRRCFTDHLEKTPSEEVEDKGPFVYDRRAYTKCMREGAEEELSRSTP